MFEGGRNRANLEAAEARYDQSLASYRGAVLAAFRDVEDSLSDLATLASQSEAVNRALVSARDTASLASERYQKGLSNYLDVVDAQRVALQAERRQAQLAGQRAVSSCSRKLSVAAGNTPSHFNALHQCERKAKDSEPAPSCGITSGVCPPPSRRRGSSHTAR